MLLYDRSIPVSQIPQCSCPISYNTPYWENELMYFRFCSKIRYCGRIGQGHRVICEIGFGLIWNGVI